MSKVSSVEFISDFVCPWCFIGITRLGRIQKKLSDDVIVKVNVLPYLLYPDIPPEGSDKKIFARKSRPGMGRALKTEAEKEGIVIDYKKIEKIPNTLESHRLSQLVEDSNQRWRLTKAIFSAYFSEGVNIGSKENLISIAKNAEVNIESISKFENSENGIQRIENLIELNKNRYIRVVPTLGFDQKLIMSGLQDERVWTKFIKKSAELSSN